MNTERIEKLVTQPKISGYQLLTLLSRNLKGLGLKPSESLVLMALASYWNGKPVFPKIKTLCDNTNLSDKAVRLAISNLIEKGYLIKTKRGKNANVYSLHISNIVKSTAKSGKEYLTSAVKITAPCKEVIPCEIKTTTTRQTSTSKDQPKGKVVVSLSNSLNEIPAIIRDNPKIKKPLAYWKSLSLEAKEDYLKQQKEAEEKAERKKEQKLLKQKEAEEKAREELLRKKELEKPLNERFSKENAILYIWRLRNYKGLCTRKNSLAQQLAGIYNLDIEEIFALSEQCVYKESVANM